MTNPIAIRDSETGKDTGLWMDADAIRDVNGKPLFPRIHDDKRQLTLTEKAAVWMSERKVLMDLAIGDVATAKTQAEFGIDGNDYIAEQVSPIDYVTHERGVWYTENVADSIALPLPPIAATGSPSELNPGYTSTSFVAVGYALKTSIPWRVIDNSDFDIKERATFRLCEGLKLAREYRLFLLLSNPNNWATANRIAVSAGKWNATPGVAQPLTDLFAALAASQLPVTSMILSEKVAQYFFNQQPGADQTTQVRDYVQAGGKLPNILYGAARFLSGGTNYVWSPGTTVNVPVIRSRADNKTLQTSRTFRWLGDTDEQSERRMGMLVREYRDDAARADVVVVAHNDYEAMITNTIGALITGAMA